MGFADQLARFAAETKDKADAVVRETVLEIGERVIARSPVLTGAFRGNWNYGLEARDAFFNAARVGKELNNLEELPQKAAGFVHFISNHAAYGPALENGHSQQAPQGMVRLTALQFDSIVAAAALKVQR